MNFKSMFLQADGSLDEAVFFGFLGELALVGLQIYSIHEGKSFDAQAFGIAFGSILGGVAAVMGFRK